MMKQLILAAYIILIMLQLRLYTFIDAINRKRNDVEQVFNPFIESQSTQDDLATEKKHDKTKEEEKMPTVAAEDIPLWSHEHHKQLLELIEHSKKMSAHDLHHNITAAICHKTLYGDIDLWTVIDWTVYHHLLGFDKIMISYTADMIGREGFGVLQSLPYVNFFENVQGYLAMDRIGHFVEQNETARKGKLTQNDLIKKCMTEDAKDYDWVLHSDADEYLWFNKTIGVKDFLSTLDSTVTYLSFGKDMYTTSYTVKSAKDRRGPFFLEEYPFFAGKFCLVQQRQNRTCAGAPGRSKIMAKPAHHDWVNIHGFLNDEERYEGAFVVPGDWALLREWRGSNNPRYERATVMPQESFGVKTVDKLYVHAPIQYFFPENGTANVYYDTHNKEWFDYIASRGQ